jgi:antitoxin component of MazEF toxin-antitoxin module
MKTSELKVARIGNSRGVRIPAATLARYGIRQSVVMEELSDGILLRPKGSPAHKLSFEATAAAMAAEAEDWSAWESTIADGLAGIPWERAGARRVAEKKTSYRGSRPLRKK